MSDPRLLWLLLLGAVIVTALAWAFVVVPTADTIAKALEHCS
jgi:hypothetical protein